MNILRLFLKCFSLDKIFATKAEGKISDNFIQCEPSSEMNQVSKSKFVKPLENKGFFVERYNKRSKCKDGKQINLLS